MYLKNIMHICKVLRIICGSLSVNCTIMPCVLLLLVDQAGAIGAMSDVSEKLQITKEDLVTLL